MRRLTTGLFVVLLGGCQSDSLPGDAADGGAGGGATLDAQGLDCDALQGAVQSWIAGHRTCRADADCTRAVTRCGLDGLCGVYLNATAVDGLATLSAAWDAQTCGAAIDCQPCPTTPPRPAACILGVCEPSPPRPTGAPCQNDLECEQQCLAAPPFTGGYCTQPQLQECPHGGTCPSGASCQSVQVTVAGQLTTQWVCLDVCATMDDCREGYRCCPSWSHGPRRLVCHPEPCP